MRRFSAGLGHARSQHTTKAETVNETAHSAPGDDVPTAWPVRLRLACRMPSDPTPRTPRQQPVEPCYQFPVYVLSSRLQHPNPARGTAHVTSEDTARNVR